jgi:hypothetical protein
MTESRETYGTKKQSDPPRTKSNLCGMCLTDKCETAWKIVEVLKDHRGSASAIKAPDLSQAVFGTRCDRKLRNCVSNLHQLGALIGSSTGKHPGYFVAETFDEVRSVVYTFQHRATVDYKIARKLVKSAQRKFGGQELLPLSTIDRLIEELER